MGLTVKQNKNNDENHPKNQASGSYELTISADKSVVNPLTRVQQKKDLAIRVITTTSLSHKNSERRKKN